MAEQLVNSSNNVWR